MVSACSVNGGRGADESATTAVGPLAAQLTAWKPCPGDLECASLAVPLDWRQPKGATIDLAVARRKATGPGGRIGSLLFNPGGPAESGVKYLRDIGQNPDRFPRGLGQRFDIVSWDTRGSGASAPIRCTTPKEFEQAEPDPTPDTPAEVATLDAKAHRDMRQCVAKAGKLFAHVGTASTARDLEALRQALGDTKLSYVGYSYGTVIGTLYAERYPTHIRAMVLDGVALPGEDPIDETHLQIRSFERNLDDFLADCARRSDCRFGAGDPKAALAALLADLEAGKRLPASYTAPGPAGSSQTRQGTLGIGEIYSGLILPLYSRSTWPALEQALADATDPSHPEGFRLLSFRDQLLGRQLDGTWDSSSDGRTVIRCEDSAARARSVVGDRARVKAWARELPFFGAVGAVGLPGCYLFPRAAEALRPPPDGSITKAPPIVIVSSTRDPATPYLRGKELQRKIRGSVVVTWDSADHTAYGRQSPCLDGPITRYLIELTVPRDGLRCAPTSGG